MEQRFRRQASSERLEAVLQETRRAPLRPLPAGTMNKAIRCTTPGHVERQHRFRLMLLKRAYSLADWLPVEAVLNLRRVDVDQQGRYVLLTLHSGTQLLDTGDRITVRGTADDIAVEELAACCERRDWTAVEVTGDHEFRMAASRELLRRGIEVVDCPLPDEEAEAFRCMNLPLPEIPEW